MATNRLTPAQREAAQICRLSEAEYAAGLEKTKPIQSDGGMGDNEFIIEGPNRIRLSAYAREIARESGMSDEDMARHLLARNKAGVN